MSSGHYFFIITRFFESAVYVSLGYFVFAVRNFLEFLDMQNSHFYACTWCAIAIFLAVVGM